MLSGEPRRCDNPREMKDYNVIIDTLIFLGLIYHNLPLLVSFAPSPTSSSLYLLPFHNPSINFAEEQKREKPQKRFSISDEGEKQNHIATRQLLKASKAHDNFPVLLKAILCLEEFPAVSRKRNGNPQRPLRTRTQTRTVTG